MCSVRLESNNRICRFLYIHTYIATFPACRLKNLHSVTTVCFFVHIGKLLIRRDYLYNIILIVMHSLI